MSDMNGYDTSEYERFDSHADYLAKVLGHGAEETIAALRAEGRNDEADAAERENEEALSAATRPVPCKSCGKVHESASQMFGNNPPPMTRVSDAERAQVLEDVLSDVFGKTLPGTRVHVVSRDSATLDFKALSVINTVLIAMATAEGVNAGVPTVQAVQQLMASRELYSKTMATFGLATPTDRMNYFAEIGKKLLTTMKAIQEGKTSGLFVAPF